jgi:hypothetical protein
MTSANTSSAAFVPPEPCPPDCLECDEASAQEWADIEAEYRTALDAHNDLCVAEAIADAFATGHDTDEDAWFVAAQLLEDGHSPCRCTAR